MKPDYKNWIPKGMLVSLIAGTVLSLALLLVFGVFGIGVRGKLRVVLGVVFALPLSFVQSSPSGACMPIGSFPMTASASSQSRSLTARRSISRCRRAAWN